jgi:hypothetical protein
MVYEIDTDGYLRVLFPYDCSDDGFVVGGRDYRIGKGAYGRYYVTGPKGVEYVHVLASFRPFRQVYWHGCHGYEDYAYDVTWNGFTDYWGCALPPRIHGDPYVAMQTIDEFICMDAIEAGMVYADFTYFYVESRVTYPRYVCYDCHGYHAHLRPYMHVCTGFSITFVDCDPFYRPWSWWWWCSPTRVYCGPRYVCYCKKPCRSYPSTYKWKTRNEYRRDGRHRYVKGDEKWKEQVREPYKVAPVRVRDASAVDGVRVKTTTRKTKDLDLYSRRDVKRPAERIKARSEETPRVVRDKQASKQSAKGVRVTPRVKIEKAKKSVKIQRAKPSEPEKPKAVKVKKTKVKETKKQVTRSKASIKSASKRQPKQETKKKVAPKVRKSKGRSPATRRRVSE